MKKLAIALSFVLLIGAGGVFATWQYAQTPASPQSDVLNILLNLFEYAPEEILPGGDAEEAPLGENHFYLVNRILNEADKGYGLNAGDNGVLHTYLNNQGRVYSNQHATSGNLKFVLDSKTNTDGLYYCLEYISDTEYYAYTFASSTLTDAAENDTEIVAYRTILVKDGDWKATTSYLGYAKVRHLDVLGIKVGSKSIPYSIDMRTWHT